MPSPLEGTERRRRHSPSPATERSGNQRQSHRSEGDYTRRRRGSSAADEDRRKSSKHDRSRRHSPEEIDRSRRRHGSRDRHRDRRRSVSREDSDRRHRKSRRHDDDSRRRHHSRSRSPRRRHHHHSRSPSPPAKRRRSVMAPSSPPPPRRPRGPLPSQQESFRPGTDAAAGDQPVEKQKPNFNATGLLAKEANTAQGTNTVLKYHEPAEARKPPSREQWRMFVFKQKDMIDTIHLYSRSCWLVGRDQQVVDFLLEHPSISKQHAVIQFRHITKTTEYGDKQSKVKPYLIDLDSANGTRLNGSKVEPSRYVELRDGDVVGFGDSEREYVMMLPPA